MRRVSPVELALWVGVLFCFFLFLGIILKDNHEWPIPIRAAAARAERLGKQDHEFRATQVPFSSELDIADEDATSFQDLIRAINGGNTAADDKRRQSSPKKALIVAAQAKDNTSWAAELPDWSPYVYITDNISAPYHTAVNKGRESLAYLTYIIEHYDDGLGETMAFVHAHRDGYPRAWHVDAPDHSNVEALRLLQPSYVQEVGYTNMRCQLQPGCPREIFPRRSPPDPEKEAENAMVGAWRYMFPGVQVPHALGAPCCAQFAVSATQLRQRSKEEYVRYREWVLKTDLSDAVSGRVMEFLWHVIFGRPPEDCGNLLMCYCGLYGRCHVNTDFNEF